MRVISGDCKGRRLSALEGEHTRPTSEKAKEAMFSILQFDLEDRTVLDLFAGSGQLGIEALSRGAKHCTFVENDRSAFKVVTENVEHCGLGDRAAVVFSDYKAFLKRGGKFGLIIIDPPYGSDCAQSALELIMRFDTLELGGIIIVESGKDAKFDETFGLERGREYKYSRTKLSLFHRPL